MLHEIVMCLLGNIGGLFQYKTENNIKKIKVNHPANIQPFNE